MEKKEKTSAKSTKSVKRVTKSVAEEAVKVEAPVQEVKETKKPKKKSRWYFRLLRIIFIWIPLTLVLLVAGALLFAKLYLKPQTVERLIIDNFNKSSNGTISLKVKEFDPYKGFVFEDIAIDNGPEFGKSKFLRIKRVVFRYGFFSIFTGNIHFDEVGIYSTDVYLKQKNGVWNVAKLMKPSEKKEEEKEEPEEPSEPAEEINLPISVNFLFNFIIDKLSVYVDGEEFDTHMKNLDLAVNIDVPPFKKVPLSLKAVNIIKLLKIELNRSGKLDFAFSSPDAAIEPPLILSWKLVFDNPMKEGVSPNFESSLRFGTSGSPVRFQKSRLNPLTFSVFYDLAFNPDSDSLNLDSFGVSFANNRWIDLRGKVTGVTKNQSVNIAMKESRIDLDSLYPYFRSITNDDKTRFKGVISLLPLDVKGTVEKMDIGGNVKLANVAFKNPGIQLTLPSLDFRYDVAKRGDNFDVSSSIDIPKFRYVLDRSESKDNGFRFTAKAKGIKNFRDVLIEDVTLRYFDPVKDEDALKLGLRGSIYTKPNLKGDVEIYELKFQKEPLAAILPESIGSSLAGIPLKKPVNIDLKAGFSLSPKRTAATLALNAKVPDFDVNDIVLRANVENLTEDKEVRLNELTLESKSKGISLNAEGNVGLARAPISDSDLKLSLKVHYPKMTQVFGPWNLSGDILLDAGVKGDLEKGKAFGSFKIEKLFVKNDESKLYVDNVNMNFPFEYPFATKYTGESRISVDKSKIIENEQFKEKENFTIASIRAKHPARDVVFEYLKNFSATMFFKNNAFEMKKLKTDLLDGTVYGRDILFYLADFNVANMEYNLVMDITNVDVARLDDLEKKKSRDAELSMNMAISGKGLDVAKELTPSGYVNIYKIGDKFANRLLKGLSEEKGKSKLGSIGQFVMDNAQIPKGFYFYIDKGNVYTTVTLKKAGAFGYIVGIKDDKIEYERMPIGELIRKVGESK